jgi:hypothetical protein
MGCSSCGGAGSKVKYQVKIGGKAVGKPQDSVAAAHALGKASTTGNQTYTFSAVPAR